MIHIGSLPVSFVTTGIRQPLTNVLSAINACHVRIRTNRYLHRNSELFSYPEAVSKYSIRTS